MIAVIILVIVVVLIVVFLVSLYNGLIKLKNKVDNAWAQIDVQLRRRYDLIPNLVKTVKGYAAHEQETLEKVIAARNAGVNASGPEEQAQAENMITGALKNLFALSEAYPDLKANQNFLELQEELTVHRGQDRLLAAVLQRHREPLQHQDPDLPIGRGRRDPALHAQGVLRGRGRRTRSRQRAVLNA